MYLYPEISNTALWLLAIAFLAGLMLAAIYFFRVRSVAVYRRKADHERPRKADSDFLPATIVVYSQGDSEPLQTLLAQLLNQQYPAAYEIIVVNEGESADVRDTVSMLRASHPNIYLTFTPEGVVNLSRKKLALTLGIKAARYDIVVLTTSAVEIESPMWLRNVMQPFDRDGTIDIVLGFAYSDPDEDETGGRRCRAFDAAADSVRWLGPAIVGKPFRGTEYNIAYRKKAFLDNKGFARSLNLHYGDDDIFISEIVRPGNTAVELSDASMVRLRNGNHPRIFSERVLRHVFTESFIRRRPRILMPLTGWLQIVAFTAAIVAGVLDYPNLYATAIAAVIIVLICVMDILFWRKALHALKARSLCLTIPWFSATYPIRRLIRKLHSRISKQKKYTWT